MLTTGNLAQKLDAAKHHVLFQHNPQTAKGYVTIAQKDRRSGRFTQRFFTPNKLADHLADMMGEDVFISQNTFYRKARRIETVKQLRSLYVDLDFYIFNYTPEQIIYWLEEDYFNRTIPEPNMIVFSGQGVVLVWTIEPVPYMALPLWQAIQNYLIGQLKPLGGDPKAADAARVFRLAGTISSKNGNEVHVQYRHEYQYTLREIQDGYLPELKPRAEKKCGRKKKIVHLYNVYTLHGARLQDLSKLVTIRQGDMEGTREITLFLYRYWSCCFEQDPEAALQHTIEFNKLFTSPLPQNEVVRATQSAEAAYKAKSEKEANEQAKAAGYPGAGYRLKNTTIIDWLGITEEEQRHLKTILGPTEKRRRNTNAKRETRRAAGVIPREEYIRAEEQKTLNKLDSLIRIMQETPSLSNRKIAKEMGISEAYVRKLKAKL